MIEFRLISHPLDCPTCDKGGECPLQNQAMSNGAATSRFRDQKRTFAKPLAISTQILLDRERCIMCQRCTRFQQEIAGDPFIDLQERGAGQQIGTFNADLLGFEQDAPGTGLREDLTTESALRRTSPGGEPGLPGASDQPVGAAAADISGRPFSSYFSGNTIQICPVGALTSSAYRFRSRPFDLVSSPAIGEHDACGAAIRIDHRAGKVLRRQSGEDAAVNEEWISDKDRFAFPWQRAADRITRPLVRNAETGELEATTWQEALHIAADGLAKAKENGGVGVLPGGRLTVEDAYGYSKFARTILQTNDIDFRSRPHSDEEEAFLANAVAGTGMGTTYTDLENASVVLLLGLEPEDEAATIWLRLRKANRRKQLPVYAVGPYESRGLNKLNGQLIAAAPGTEAEVIDAILAGKETSEMGEDIVAKLRELLNQPGAVVLVGERLASTSGALTSALELATKTGAQLAWVPRRAGDRGAVEAGALPQLLPGGRPVSDAQARVDAGAVWGIESLPVEPGRNFSEILEAAANKELSGLVIGGVELADLPSPSVARSAIGSAEFVLSLEVRTSDVTELAHVVLPVAPPSEKAGTYLNWEGRVRGFERALESNAMSDHRVLNSIADEMDDYLGLASAPIAFAELEEFDGWEGERAGAPEAKSADVPSVAAGQAVLATWKQLLDLGRGQDGEPYLAGTQRLPVARISAQTAAASSIIEGGLIEISNANGKISLPAVICDMPDGVVWVPTNSQGSRVRETLEADAGAVVEIAPGTAAETSATEKEVVA